MGQTYADLLDQLIDVRDCQYPTDPERDEARLKILESVVQTMLEKLRNQFDPR